MCHRFPRLFNISTQKNGGVGEIGRWRTEEFYGQIHILVIANLNLGDTAKTEIEPFVIHRSWKSVAPSNVCAFLWQLLLDWITSRTNLF